MPENKSSTFCCSEELFKELMSFDYFIMCMGVETHTDEYGDKYRPIQDIVKDIVTVCNNNPTIIDECVEFAKENPCFDHDKFKEFYSKHNLDGIYKIESLGLF